MTTTTEEQNLAKAIVHKYLSIYWEVQTIAVKSRTGVEVTEDISMIAADIAGLKEKYSTNSNVVQKIYDLNVNEIYATLDETVSLLKKGDPDKAINQIEKIKKTIDSKFPAY